jgi:37-kD nucleoid-associated bacterial protein
MSVKIRFTSATATGLVLAKVGHPQRDEPLQTSKEVFKVAEEDQETLAAIFLKPFKNLTAHRFSHHSSLDQHEMNAYSAAIFAADDGLLEKGCDIAKRLYAKSNHPNIKSGDLCISLIKDIEVDGSLTQGLCILKSESVVPFLSISTRDGDLELHTEQGINPEKIDKGCLIIDHLSQKGYYVLTFDRSGNDSRFWVRDFLGVIPITDSPFLTHKYANMAVAFMEKEKKQNPVASDDSPPWDASNAAREAITYFEEKENFSLHEFEEEVLKTPEAKAKFAEHRSEIEKEQGHRLDDTFEISKKDVSKAKKKIRSMMKLDTGVEIRLKPSLAAKPDHVLEHGFDEGKKMKFIKIFFNEDLAD